MDKVVKQIRDIANPDKIIGYRNLQMVQQNHLLYAENVVLMANSRKKYAKIN